MNGLLKKAALALAAASLMMTTACSGSKSSASDSSDSGASVEKNTTMNIVLSTAPVGLHPLTTNDAPPTYVNGQIFETLYKRTIDGTSYEPLLAEELPICDEEGTSCTIKLRENVTFQDGTPFTADDVAYMIDSLKDPNYGSQRPSIVESIVSYEILDEHNIKLNLAYPDGVLVAKLAHTNGAIVNPELDQSQDLMVNPAGAGTGAYEFVSSIDGSTYTLKAYENYWGGTPEIKDVVFTVVADESTAIARLQTGEADFYATVSADSFNQVLSLSNVTAVNTPASSVYYLALRSDSTAANDAMADLELRKAILMAIDMDTFVSSVLDGLAVSTNSIVGPTLVGYDPIMETYGYSYDPEEAKRIIEENGYTGTEITFLIASRAWQQTLAAYIQSNLEAVGLKVNIVTEEWASFLADAKNDDVFDMAMLSWSNVTGDGQQMLEPNFSTTNGVRLKYNNAEFDEYVENSARTMDVQERVEWMCKAVEKIQGDAVVKTLYSANQLYAYNNRFTNIELDCGGQYDIKNFKFAD